MAIDKLPTKLWIDALIRRVQLGGASAFILQRGDDDRGDVLIKVAHLDGTARLIGPAWNFSGERVFLDFAAQGVGPHEKDIDAYLGRARERDNDLWIVEIEDRDGRHFLTEAVEAEIS